MEKLAVHMRISGVTVSDDDVNSRRTAASALSTSWGKQRTVSTIISKAAEIAEALGGNGTPPTSLGSEVQTAIQKKSSSFLYEDRPLDVGVCAGMAALAILDGTPGDHGWTTPDVYAAALWSALAYQPVLETERRENLRRDVLDAASSRVVMAGEKSRERKNVADPSAVKITIDSGSLATSNFNEAMNGTIEALRRNAALDREELDFLWWAQLGRSRVLNRQLSAISEPTRIVVAGIEGAKLLRRLPCEVHREIVLRTLDKDPELDLLEMLASVGEDRPKLRTAFNETNVAAHPTIFPFLYALSTGEVDGPGALEKRRVSEWGERALLEAGFAKMMSQGAGKL